MELNNISVSQDNGEKYSKIEEFPLTWFSPKDRSINIGTDNIKGAWEEDKKGVNLPVAIHPTYLHPRMSAQRSVFTVHGTDKTPIYEQVSSSILTKFVINPRARRSLVSELGILGIEEATAFPDLDGLAKELSKRY